MRGRGETPACAELLLTCVQHPAELGVLAAPRFWSPGTQGLVGHITITWGVSGGR